MYTEHTSVKSWFHKQRNLLFWLGLTFISSILHYVHNIIYFEYYPEPEWLDPHMVDAFWFFMTPFALLGLILHYMGRLRLAGLSFSLYALMNLLTLLHYGCEIKIPISLTIHVFIWFEAICAIVLAVFVGKSVFFKSRK